MAGLIGIFAVPTVTVRPPQHRVIVDLGLSFQITQSALELELIQTHKAQKPVLRVEVGARALRVRSVSREGA